MWRGATSGSGWQTVSVSRQRTTRFDVNFLGAVRGAIEDH